MERRNSSTPKPNMHIDNFDNMGFPYKKIVNVIYHILCPYSVYTEAFRAILSLNFMLK